MFEIAFPPVAGHGAIAEIFHTKIVHIVYHVDMAAETGLHIFMLVEKLDQFLGVCMHIAV